MGSKRKTMEDEMSRFEAEISSSSVTYPVPAAAPMPASNPFIPSQVRTVIGSQTYNQVQQKLAQVPPRMPPPPMPPYMPSYSAPPQPLIPPKSYSSEPTPVIVSSAPKLYTARPTVGIASKPEPSAGPSTSSAPTVQSYDIANIQYEVSNKMKKPKTEKSGPNPIAEEAIKAARASSALQSFGNSERRGKKDKKQTVRVAGGQTWEDMSLSDWPEDDFRIFCGDLGNDVNDELLTRTFNKYPSFQRAKVIRDKRTSKSKGYGFVSFKDPQDFIRAMKEMDGRYVGSRPIKLRKSTWKNRSIEVVRKKDKEKQALLSLFNQS
ncbi:RNA-binding protein 42 [Anopheles ziemanni]|uniref:RNA-binding protein 42 n=1 Tax=Anopheles coustani TaxID=139045 RepID=UPI00265B607F|nr:RNA-binding protein 42 [Anopheles coustani]XP_058178936.1 RNA-binding protein 42 [Anopheles ziemanni]